MLPHNRLVNLLHCSTFLGLVVSELIVKVFPQQILGVHNACRTHHAFDPMLLSRLVPAKVELILELRFLIIASAEHLAALVDTGASTAIVKHRARVCDVQGVRKLLINLNSRIVVIDNSNTLHRTLTFQVRSCLIYVDEILRTGLIQHAVVLLI